MTFDDTDGLTSDLGYQRYSHLFNTRSSLTEILFLFSAGKGADDGSGVVGIKTRTGGMERWDPGWWHMNIFFLSHFWLCQRVVFVSACHQLRVIDWHNDCLCTYTVNIQGLSGLSLALHKHGL